MRLGHRVVRLTMVFGLIGASVAGISIMMSPEQYRAHGVVFMKPRDPASNLLSTSIMTLHEGELQSIVDVHHLFPTSRGNDRQMLLRRAVRVNLLRSLLML